MVTHLVYRPDESSLRGWARTETPESGSVLRSLLYGHWEHGSYELQFAYVACSAQILELNTALLVCVSIACQIQHKKGLYDLLLQSLFFEGPVWINSHPSLLQLLQIFISLKLSKKNHESFLLMCLEILCVCVCVCVSVCVCVCVCLVITVIRETQAHSHEQKYCKQDFLKDGMRWKDKSSK